MNSSGFDVAVIGGGVVGTAIARELAQFTLSTILIESGPDVGAGTSKANTALFHTGFDAPPGSLEARLLKRGFQRLKAYAVEVGIPLEPTGGILVAWSQAQLSEFPVLQENARKNGETLRPLSAAQVYDLEPNLGAGLLGGLLIEEEGIICPFTPPLAFATQAKVNGVSFLFDHPVQGVRRHDAGSSIKCGDLDIDAAWVINAAGLHSDRIDAMFGYSRFQVTPRRGQLLIYDKCARSLVSRVILPVPSGKTKGVMVGPTVFGNLLLGPTAEDLEDKSDTSTSAAGFRFLMKKGRQILPALEREEVTAAYSGLRAATEHQDYQIYLDPRQRYVCVGGIRSTGLSASMGIAEHVVGLLRDAGVRLHPRDRFKTIAMPYLGEGIGKRPSEIESRIRENPDYGRIVCHCEQVSRGEIIDALKSPLPPTDLDGLRRRTRCLQGRCQGFYCTGELVELMAQMRRRSGEQLMGLEWA